MNGESTSIVWPSLASTTAEAQNRTASAVDSIQRSSVRLCSEWIALAVWDVRSQYRSLCR